VHDFTVARRGDAGAQVAGGNVVGLVRGTTNPDRYVVVTAHYDHVGVGRPVDGDSIYNGADDNASGTAALLALAEHFARNPAGHSLLFVAFDAEEQGLRGARAFVAEPPVPKDAIALNVNMDMVSHSERGELYAAGAAKYPRLRAPLQRAAAGAPVRLLLGHDMPEPTPRDDWTGQSDQGAFHAAGIPFVYFGVEDHPDYHRPSDEVGTITPGFYVNAVRTIAAAIRELDLALR
jgi:Zn-dependent M28 family amino/carboxypeptidase